MVINKKIHKPIYVSALIILVVAIGIGILSDTGTRQLKKRLETTSAELRAARDTILSVKEKLGTLQQELTSLKSGADILSLQRDSLLLNFRRRNAVDWNQAVQIEQEQKILNEKLRILRQTDNKLKW